MICRHQGNSDVRMVTEEGELWLPLFTKNTQHSVLQLTLFASVCPSSSIRASAMTPDPCCLA